MLQPSIKDQLASLTAGSPPQDDAGLFGASIPEDAAQLVVLGVPWEATTSFGRGTAQAPHNIVMASHQLDLLDQDFGESFLAGIAYRKLACDSLNTQAASAALEVIAAIGRSGGDRVNKDKLALVNKLSQEVDTLVYRESLELLRAGKVVGMFGGDHSCPAGLLQAISEQYSDTTWGILHIDAHHDLRLAYEGFERSHASIMRNVMEQLRPAPNLVSIGIRDYCVEEADFAAEHPQITTFYDREIQKRLFCGETFDAVAEDIVMSLPEAVYVSFDIDGLDPQNCPQTGTPVPGGFSYAEAIHLLVRLVETRRKLIGFDLSEVAVGENGGDWDLNVGARILYKLCGAVVASQGLKPIA